jgi:hypothetical protein
LSCYDRSFRVLIYITAMRRQKKEAFKWLEEAYKFLEEGT